VRECGVVETRCITATLAKIWLPGRQSQVQQCTTPMAPSKRHHGSTYSSKQPKGSAVPAAIAANKCKRVFMGEEVSGGQFTMNDMPYGANWCASCNHVEVDFGGGLSLVSKTPTELRSISFSCGSQALALQLSYTAPTLALLIT
jgi:hypothetical protein